MTVVIILACLLIMGTCGLIALNVSNIVTDLEGQNPIMAFVNEDLSDAEAQGLETAIRAVPNVREVQFISREQAMENFISKLRESSLFDRLDATVFRHRYIIYLDDIAIMAKTQQDSANVPGIAWVNAHLGISASFVSTQRVVNVVSAALIILLFIICMAIMSSALRVTAYERRKEVSLVKMIGANNSFVRWPITIEGIALGLTGSLLSYLLQWVLYSLLEVRIKSSGLAFLAVIPFREIALPLLAAFLFLGLLAAVLGSRIAIRNYIRI
jgi:cell division transport system permease protein